MLTDSEEKWLEDKDNYELRFGFASCGRCQYFRTLYDDWTGHCHFLQCPKIEKPDFRDAAEFEARVVEKLAQSPCWNCPEKSKLSCPRGKLEANGRPKTESCRLKHARLAVEEEME